MAKTSLVFAGASSSKSLLFMMVAMACGVCVLVGAGLFMASRIIHSLGLQNSSDHSTVRTPLGEFRLEKLQQIGPGLPVYPQATLVLPGTEAARLPSNDAQPQVVSSTYHTNASREYVVNWYLEHLSPEFVRQDSGPKNLPDAFRDAHISGEDITFTGERGDQIRVVALALDDMGTRITLLRSSKASTQSQSSTPTPVASPSQ